MVFTTEGFLEVAIEINIYRIGRIHKYTILYIIYILYVYIYIKS